MSILSGYGKFKRYVLTDSGYKLCSQWTSSNTVHFDDDKTAQTKLGAIDGITDSLTATSSNVALSSKAGNNLQSQINELNTGLGKINFMTQSQWAFEGRNGNPTSDLVLHYGKGNVFVANYNITIPNGYTLLVAFPRIAWFSSHTWGQQYKFLDYTVTKPSGNINIALMDSGTTDTFLYATVIMECIFVKV